MNFIIRSQGTHYLFDSTDFDLVFDGGLGLLFCRDGQIWGSFNDGKKISIGAGWY